MSEALRGEDAALAAALLAIDPEGLGGVVLRGPPSAARDAWIADLKRHLGEDAPIRKAPSHVDDDRLLGGLDLALTLQAGRPVLRAGLLREAAGGAVIAPMAERCTPAFAARLVAAQETAPFLLVALDESRDDEEAPPGLLRERCAFWLPIPDASPRSDGAVATADVARARDRLRTIAAAPDALMQDVCLLAARWGVTSIRALVFANAAARASAALHGRVAPNEDDAILAARLVLAPRAVYVEASEAPAEQPPAPPPEAEASPAAADAAVERLVEAAESALPQDFLRAVVAQQAQRGARARASGAGARAKSPRRGRPLTSRPGALRAGDRLDLVATLRAAAPWKRLRGAGARSETITPVRRADFRIRRFVQKRESTTIFVVDSSGSTALQRLAEVKGAIQTLLADAYVSRARVALIAFRQNAADLVVPPTRSLTQAKRRLGDLIGGGATPLAGAIDAAHALAVAERIKGRTPLIVVLSDGRGNVARDGTKGRAVGDQDARAAAAALRAALVDAVVIDCAPHDRGDARALAHAMGAAYAPLPFVHAEGVDSIVRAHAPPR